MTGPWNVPSNWRWAKMGDVARVVGGSTPKTNEPSYWGGDIPWITPDDLSRYRAKYIDRGRRGITQAGYESCSTQMVPRGTVLFTSRAPIGYVAIAASEVCTNQGFKSFVCGPDVSPDFVYWYLRKAGALAKSMASGTTFLELSAKAAAALPIPVPPIGEQLAIVAQLESLFTRVQHAQESLRSALARTERLRASAVARALVQVPSPPTENGSASDLLAMTHEKRAQLWRAAGKGSYRQPSSPADGVISSLPEGWALASLEQITDPIRTISYGILMPKENVSDGIPYVRVKDMRGDRIDLDALHRTSPTIAARYPRSSLKSGDLLVAIRGSYGRVAEVPEELEGGNITQVTARVDVIDLVSRRYVAAYLRSPVAQTHLKRVARGVAVKGVNIGDLRALPVPIPPRSQQDAIADAVESQRSVIAELESEVRTASRRADILWKDLLRIAFEGRLPALEQAGGLS